MSYRLRTCNKETEFFLLRSYYENHRRRESGRENKSSSESLPGTTKAKLAPIVHADHPRREIAKSDPEVLLAAELGQRARTLHERYPGARARAPRQRGVRSGRRRARCQQDHGHHACASIAKAGT